MPNSEHLAILDQGVEKWNKWRSNNSEIQPDLSNALLSMRKLSKVDLRGANLEGANFTMANLREAMLHGAFLRGAFLGKTDLNGAILSRAYLVNALLRGADLSGADLSGADLNGANLEGAYITGTNFSGIIFIEADFSRCDFSGLNLSGAILRGANLSWGNFSGADLSGADLAMANLERANFRDAILARANLIKADLNMAYLRGANLRGTHLAGASLTGARLDGADMRSTNLDGAMLISAKLDAANLTEAHLWETRRAGWSIKGVICDSVYWNGGEADKTIYDPGEFERLFAEKTKVKLFYKSGISPLEITTLPALIKHLEESHHGCSLRLVAIRDDAGGAVIELAVEDAGGQSTEQLKQLEAEAQQNALYLREVLGQVSRLEGQAAAYEWTIKQLLSNQKPTYQLSGINFNMGDTSDVSGQTGAVGPNAPAHDNTFNQIVNRLEQCVDLTAPAKELSDMNPVKLFYSYSHKDEDLREELVKHLTILRRQGVLEPWHDRDIEAGAEWNQEIERHLNEAQIILLLISSDFIASPFCWDKEMARAMERHEASEAVVIPIILRSCDWKGAPFGKLQGLPKDMKPVNEWSNRDQAFTNVAQGIRKVAEKLAENP